MYAKESKLPSKSSSSSSRQKTQTSPRRSSFSGQQKAAEAQVGTNDEKMDIDVSDKKFKGFSQEGEGVLQANGEMIGNSQGGALEESRRNHTGLPDSLKTGIENLSGYSMDDVRVHYNSHKPAQLQAHAYTQGTDIYLASGQQKHLPHEVWHVVQQKQGRVKPTMQLKGKVNVNDDMRLEKEADLMGAKAWASGKRNIVFTTDAVQNKSKNGFSRNVSQLVADIRFTNLSQDETAVRKSQQIRTQLFMSNEITQYLANKDCVIRIENPGFSQLTPAEVVDVAGQVQVTIAPWFFDISDVGEIIGMLAHEFAVHPMADENLNRIHVANEEALSANNQVMDSQYKKQTINFFANETHKLQVDQDNQRDHLFMVKKDEPRAEYYRQVTYELVNGLLTSVDQGANGITLNHVKQAIISYLGDLAMTVISNDHKNQIKDIGMAVAIWLPMAIKEAREYWKVVCNRNNSSNGKRIWEISQGWIMGAEQAVAFINKQANRDTHQTQSQNNNDPAVGMLTANQNQTITEMGWGRNWIDLNNTNGVIQFFDISKSKSSVQDPSIAMVNQLTSTQNITQNINILVKAIHIPGQPWPAIIEEATLGFLGSALKIGIYVIKRNGRLEALSRGAGKIIVIERADNGEFSFVHAE